MEDPHQFGDDPLGHGEHGDCIHVIGVDVPADATHAPIVPDLVERRQVIGLPGRALYGNRRHRADARRQIALDFAQQVRMPSGFRWCGLLDPDARHRVVGGLRLQQRR